MATVPEPKRKTCSYSFHREPLTSLIELSSLITSGNQKGFVDQYGDILTLLKMVVDPVPLQTLLQLYDPELHCFTFQDYQLAPTLEEYSILLSVPIQHQVPFLDVPKEVDFRIVARALQLSIKEVCDNWKPSGDVVGLPLKFLLRVARGEAEKGNWEVFHAQLPVMIYGIILFIFCCLHLCLHLCLHSSTFIVYLAGWLSVSLCWGGIYLSSDPGGILSLHTSGVYMMIFCERLFMLRFSRPYPGLDDTHDSAQLTLGFNWIWGSEFKPKLRTCVHSRACSLIEMATVPEPKRKTCSYCFHREPLTSLIELSSLITSGNQKGFVDQYGDILTLLKMVVDPVPLQTLLQLYDPELHCFTFQDYQLAPTLEEYSILLSVPIQHQVPFLDVPKEVDFRIVARALQLSIKEVCDNWKPSGDVVGLPLKFLLRVARGEAEKGNWEVFHAQLPVMIYGIILFPSMPNFVDYAAISIFIGGNPVPTLLADTYYAIHSRHGKGGAIRCCLPLLLRWFMSLLPVSGPFVGAQSTHKWTQRVMSLT
ncbi:hypothetical protein KIW84_021553 [Lathyrus oleraceus]|uniref:DUF7745 domain-containing protein n=1 Tax=Pisum sativum TaxID=3888 RepID=A0A9D4YCP6_PEA|nr:hypothetical protein KIW84_021553 [Pisum sativum]